MKKVITSNIAGSTGQPVKSGTLEHLQSAYQEAFQIMMKNLYGITSTDTTVRVLYGCVNTGGSTIGTTCIISAGAVYYNGELYFVPAANFLIGVGLVAVISTVANSTNFYVDAKADPVTMTDLSTPYVHSQFKITVVDGNSGTTGYIAAYSAFNYSFSDVIQEKTFVVGDITPVGGGISSLGGGSTIYWRTAGKVLTFNVIFNTVVLTGSNTSLSVDLAALAASITYGVHPVGLSKKAGVYTPMYCQITGTTPTMQLIDASGTFAAGTYDLIISGSIMLN